MKKKTGMCSSYNAADVLYYAYRMWTQQSVDNGNSAYNRRG